MEIIKLAAALAFLALWFLFLEPRSKWMLQGLTTDDEQSDKYEGKDEREN